MGLIRVQAPGLFTTVQDLGREGFGPLGVSASGAADPLALRIGNRVAGNPEGAAGLEMTLLGGTFHFPEGAVAALTGSHFEATLNGKAVEWWEVFTITPGGTLRMGPTRSGARCYLCVQGGIVVKPFLGSASTHVLSGLGGFEGRALRAGDVLAIGPATGEFTPRRPSPDLLNRLTPRKNLRATAGPQADWFPESAWDLFRAGPYRVTEEANRMGLRLEGPSLFTAREREMITEGVSLGAIQVPKGGQPIILFVEQQTTGGYPKLANVIAADLASVGQLRPRDEIRFELVGMDVARSLLVEQEELLASLD
jgi:biotin-dependent carboxylase-like uncharacterized protein